MDLVATLAARWEGLTHPFLITPDGDLSVSDLESQTSTHLSEIQSGDVVALIGDFDARSLADLLALVSRGAILVPLTEQTKSDHEYFFESSHTQWIVDSGRVIQRQASGDHPLLSQLRQSGKPGLVLFSTGTTGRPKAILHDMSVFLKRFVEPRPTLRTMAFLLFDHIGGINTLLHTLFNTGVVVAPRDRSVSTVLDTCGRYNVDVLPTTPTFLRMMLMSGLVPERFPKSLRIVTYGTERMDQPTLDQLCELLPSVDFRQTFGMSELGILRVKSKSRNSLFMRIGGDGVRTRVDSGVLKVFSPNRMMGYLNAESPFDSEGWYDTHDIVEVEDDYIKVVGRSNEVINVGGLKFMASEVERVALDYPGVELVIVTPRSNPVTGQHAEMTVQFVAGFTPNISGLKKMLSDRLPAHMVPRRLVNAEIGIGHRFKRQQ